MKPRVLYVDDNVRCRDGFAHMLSTIGCEVHVADDGYAGLNKLESSMYDLAITDYQMPGIDGLEFAKRAWSIRPDTPVVVVSGIANGIRNLPGADVPVGIFQKPMSCEGARNIIQRYTSSTMQVTPSFRTGIL